jgi:hypothetical protein
MNWEWDELPPSLMLLPHPYPHRKCRYSTNRLTPTIPPWLGRIRLCHFDAKCLQDSVDIRLCVKHVRRRADTESIPRRRCSAVTSPPDRAPYRLPPPPRPRCMPCARDWIRVRATLAECDPSPSAACGVQMHSHVEHTRFRPAQGSDWVEGHHSNVKHALTGVGRLTEWPLCIDKGTARCRTRTMSKHRSSVKRSGRSL